MNETATNPSPSSAPRRTCNRHDDCDAADARTKEATKGERLWSDHCHDECCEDCFGC